ncbi:selenoneine biosynthesis selenosugar synthase SenB [Massilia sp. Leaf139]|uniref:selenoneine biosynthesis selenosugar synthase SenB n=1 Tax=Massilia sp. Leaf139 TaxID=1736272 RepID=UPI0006FF9163|nr:selenoneine biosynthesis selenosugar synthase SenB [Massilia sp. Leaf139]KQQ89121.1 glycosyl transferase family 1 [Massilia sp. Leaf139]
MHRQRILIVSPAAARDNNGNWQTASRWARFLRARHEVAVAGGWTAGDPVPDLLIALHARRSAPALAAWQAAHPERPSVLVLTGTDLYRDIETSSKARASLDTASALVVLQEAGLQRLAPQLRAKTRIIHQSAPALRQAPPAPNPRHIDVCMIGHLRPEKDPLAFMRAAALVTYPRLRLLHIGGALDPALLEAAQATAAATPRYRWLGPLPHARTRQRLKRCRAMVIASHMEGGANVIIEAVTSGVPVLASRIDGNVGMLGADYAGFFPPGDAAALASLIDRCAADPDFDALLRRQCAARAPLFAPAAERAALADLVDNLLPATRAA